MLIAVINSIAAQMMLLYRRRDIVERARCGRTVVVQVFGGLLPSRAVHAGGPGRLSGRAVVMVDDNRPLCGFGGDHVSLTSGIMVDPLLVAAGARELVVLFLRRHFVGRRSDSASVGYGVALLGDDTGLVRLGKVCRTGTKLLGLGWSEKFREVCCVGEV